MMCALLATTTSAMLGLTLMLSLSASAADKPAPKIQVLIITGDDVGPHPWPEVSQATRDTLKASGKFEVRLCEDTGVLEAAASIKRYDVIYVAMYNAKTPTLSDLAKQNLVEFVKGGKGLVLSHLSSASFKEWDEFKKMCGRNWVMKQSGHGPRSVFKVRIADKNHPVTQGLEDFETDDELYAKMQGDTPITVLAEADSDWSKQKEPIAFVLPYGQGRVFHHTLGHDAKAVNIPAVQKLIQRGTQWAAKGGVE